MSSSARFLAAAALVLAVSLAPKILARGEAPSAPPALGSEPIPMWLGAFLADQGAQGLAKVRHRPGMPEWPGWSFTAGGCKGLAFPASPNGDLYVAARLHARPGDRIRYIYKGRTFADPPHLRRAADQVLWRVKRVAGAGGAIPPFDVVLIHPAGCDAAASLAWREL